jgi:hypothetical protein
MISLPLTRQPNKLCMSRMTRVLRLLTSILKWVRLNCTLSPVSWSERRSRLLRSIILPAKPTENGIVRIGIPRLPIWAIVSGLSPNRVISWVDLIIRWGYGTFTLARFTLAADAPELMVAYRASLSASRSQSSMSSFMPIPSRCPKAFRNSSAGILTKVDSLMAVIVADRGEARITPISPIRSLGPRFAKMVLLPFFRTLTDTSPVSTYRQSR